MQNDNIYDVERVKEILLSSEHAVFFGGAGVSTDSGIPDFRGNGGLYDLSTNMLPRLSGLYTVKMITKTS